MPWSRPKPSIRPRCHEARIDVEGKAWRIIYRADADAVVVGDVFEIRAQPAIENVIEISRRKYRDCVTARQEE